MVTLVLVCRFLVRTLSFAKIEVFSDISVGYGEFISFFLL